MTACAVSPRGLRWSATELNPYAPVKVRITQITADLPES